jgi:hypothetical protein
MAARTESPMILEPIEMPNWQVPVPSGNIASWVNGTTIVIPLNSKLRASVADGLQGIYAEFGSFAYGVAPTEAQISRTMAAGS